MCFALANYLRSKRMASVCCIEVNASGTFSHLSKNTFSNKFNYMHIVMYPSVTLSLLPNILRQPYQFQIIDFGVLHPNIYQAFLRCDSKILIGNISLWKWEQYFETIQKLSTNQWDFYHDIKLLGTPGLKENLHFAQKNVSKAIMPVPYIENPFQITSTKFGFFEKLLETIDIPHSTV